MIPDYLDSFADDDDDETNIVFLLFQRSGRRSLRPGSISNPSEQSITANL